MWSPHKLCCKCGTAQSTVFGTANRCDSELYSAAYRAERAERELGLTVVLSVCGVNIVMGTGDC